MRLSKNQWTLRYEKNLLFLYIAAVISVMQQHNTCRRLHDRHSHKHLVRGGWGREFIFFRSIYGSFFPSFLQTLETMWAKRLPTHSNEKFHFLPSHICVISTRSPSCKVRPWGIDAPFNWLIAVETRNGKEHTFKNFSFIKQVQEFFFSLRGMTPFVIVVPPTGSTLSLPPSASSWMEGLLHEYETWPTAGSSLLYTATNWWGIIKRPKL